MSSRILVVDDNVTLAGMIGIVLQSEGYEVASCADGFATLTQFQEHNPDLALLDVTLPGMDGFDVCRVTRYVLDIPIVILTTRSDTSDIVAGLRASVNDYIPKPFKPKKLVARIRVRLWDREDSQADEGLSLQDLSIDVAGHIVKREGRVIALTSLEFNLLVTLTRSPWKVFSREELLEQAWGYHHAADTRLVNVHVQHLHSKIGRDPERPELVVTIRGVRYHAGAEV